MFYLQNVRRHDKREYLGIYRQMLRVIDKGVTTAQMAQAARNYAESEFVKAIPDLRRHHIRRFLWLSASDDGRSSERTRSSACSWRSIALHAPPWSQMAFVVPGRGPIVDTDSR